MQDFIIQNLFNESILPLSDEQKDLLSIVFDVCYNTDDKILQVRPSSVAFINCMKWGGSVENAIASSLLTLNSNHGPFTETRNLIELFFEKGLDEYKKYVKLLLDNRNIVPGYGSPVFKNKNDDERCIKIIDKLSKLDRRYEEIANETKIILSYYNKNIKRNIVFCISAVASYLKLPIHKTSSLFIIPTLLRYLNLWQPH